MLNWRSISDNPSDSIAFNMMDNFLHKISRIENISRHEMVVNFVRDFDVLDIGAAGHIKKEELNNWTHGIICNSANKAVAIDINQHNCDYYNSKNYDFRCIDATSEENLGEFFDRIFISHVIEHVNDPVKLVLFAKRHLKTNGRVLITTPNPFAARFRRHRKKRKNYFVMANLEHTNWISISNMHEIAWRAGMELSAIRWPLMKKPKQGFAKKLSILTKKSALKIYPIEEVFVEYAFELSMTTEETNISSDTEPFKCQRNQCPDPVRSTPGH